MDNENVPRKRPSDEAVKTLQEIARCINRHFGVGCCELHAVANLNALYDLLAQFEDDSFEVLKGEAES